MSISNSKRGRNHVKTAKRDKCASYAITTPVTSPDIQEIIVLSDDDDTGGAAESLSHPRGRVSPDPRLAYDYNKGAQSLRIASQSINVRMLRLLKKDKIRLKLKLKLANDKSASVKFTPLMFVFEKSIHFRSAPVKLTSLKLEPLKVA